MTILMQIMSRRKQSNPKPLIKRDDEDFPANETGGPAEPDNDDDRASSASSPHTKTESHHTHSPCHSPVSPTNLDNSHPDAESGGDRDADSNPLPPRLLRKRSIDEMEDVSATSPATLPSVTPPTVFSPKSPEPPPQLFSANHLPKLRLNTALAADPSTNPDAKSLKSMRATAVEDFQDKIDENFNASQNENSHKELVNANRATEKLLKSPQVLTANLEMPPRLAMFVCGPCGIRFSSASTLEAHQTYYCSHRKDQDENGVTAKPSADGSLEPAPKSIKTGKQYACSQCSYSADKKVSLNRHMRMHQASPSPSSNASNGGDDVPPQLLANKPPVTAVQLSQQQQLLLQQQLQQQQQMKQGGKGQPTLQVPVQVPQIDRYCSDCDIRFSSTKTYRAHKMHYCSSRHREGGPVSNNASVSASPAPATAVKPSSTQKSGSQSPTESLAKSPPSNTSSQPFLALPTNPIIIIPYSLIRGASIIPGPLTAVTPGITNIDSACFMLQNGALQPIAYSLASQSNQSQTAREETPNHTHTSQHSSGAGKTTNDGEIGDVLKVKNKKDGPVRETTTPLDLSVRRLSPISGARDRSLSMSSAISAEQLRMDFEQLLESKENRSVSGDSVTPEQIVCAPSLPGSPPLTPSPKRRSNSPRGSNASVSPSSMQHLQMKSFLPADIALRLSESGLHSLPLPQLLTKHDVELALRISSASSNSDASPKQISPLQLPHPQASPSPSSAGLSPAVPNLPPQIFVKQGVSKCMECNIVFCKYENYLAHKKHYCSARNTDDTEPSKTSPPVSPQAKSPSSGGTLAYQQLICAACGIKFTSLDNLSAHQMYYCPKRLEIQVQLPVKEKCGKCKTMHEAGTPCVAVGPGSYKCPICDVVSPNSAEARRHMETHAGVKAFRCSICSYKGNTLRGMRTHIRMHFDKKTVDFNEENYITCIVEEDGVEITASKASPPVIVNNSVGGLAAGQENSTQMHYCDMCHYSSTYKGNVVRHIRLVHSQAQPPSNSPVIGEGGENLLHNGESSKNQASAGNSIVKLEPHDDKSNDVEIIVDEPEIKIKSELPERPNSVTPTLRPQSRPNSQPNHRSTASSVSPISHRQHPALQNHEISTPQPPAPQQSPGIDNKGAANHCKTCDIKFNYVNTFLAHKKFYCKSLINSELGEVVNAPQSASATNVRVTETTVL